MTDINDGRLRGGGVQGKKQDKPNVPFAHSQSKAQVPTVIWRRQSRKKAKAELREKNIALFSDSAVILSSGGMGGISDFIFFEKNI